MSKSFFSLKGKQWNNLGAYSYFAVGGHIYTRNESKYLCWGSWKTRLVLLPVCMKNDNLILFGVLWRNRVPYLPLVIKIATILMFFLSLFYSAADYFREKGKWSVQHKSLSHMLKDRVFQDFLELKFIDWSSTHFL